MKIYKVLYYGFYCFINIIIFNLKAHGLTKTKRQLDLNSRPKTCDSNLMTSYLTRTQDS